MALIFRFQGILACSLFGLMIIIWCSCGYSKMLSPWQPCKRTFWLIHNLFLIKINLIHRKSLQFIVGIPCGLNHGYCWEKVILMLCFSMWFREKIDPLNYGPQLWCTFGRSKVFVAEQQRFRGTSQSWLVMEKKWFAVRDWALTVLLEKTCHAAWDWLEFWTSAKQLTCRFVTQDARLSISKSLWSNILSRTGSSCISGGYKELQGSSVIQNLLDLV